MSLRIFEPRYLRMVKEACAGHRDFAVCMLNARGDKVLNQHIHPLCTLAKVVDFSTLDDGLLGIVVEGTGCWHIQEILNESDELRVGRCLEQSQWDCIVPPGDGQMQLMQSKLKEIFSRFPDIEQLYQQTHFSDPLWVLFRWLELLPVDPLQKQNLLQEKDCRKILHFLTELTH